MRGALASLAVAATLVCAASAHAGPWIKSPGEAYVKTGLTYFAAEQGFNQGVATGLEYTALTYNLYTEIGLPWDLQLVADIPFVTASNSSDAGVDYRNRSFGDARLEIDYGLFPGVPLALGLEVKLPLYTTAAEQPALARQYPRSASRFPDAGDGNIDITPKLLTGWSFYPVPAWATAELGYRRRTGGFVDGLFWAAGAGYFVVKDQFAVGLYGNGVVNVQSERTTGTRTKEYTYGQGYLLITGLEPAPALGLTISAGGIFHAENTARGADVSVGVSHAF